jgi:FkbH-like protein
MIERASNLLEKLARHRGKPLPVLAAKAARFTSESARAALDLWSCDEVGSGVRCSGRVAVKNQGRITIGSDVRFHAPWSPIELFAGEGAELQIGRNVQINYGTLISANKRVTIGNEVMIGNHCIIADSEQPGLPDGDATNEPLPVEIGDGAWLAVRVTVLPGAKIGAGAVITAGSVVAGEIPPGVVAGGIPARVFRSMATGADRAATPDAAAPAAHRHGNGATNGATNGTSAPAVSAAMAQPVARRVTSKGVLVSDFTIDELANHFEALPGAVGLQAQVAPFGQVVQVLMQGPDPDAADFAVVWTRPESAIPSFARIRSFETVDVSALADEVDQFCELVARGAARYRFVFVPTWTLPHYDRGLGLLDAREGGAARALAAMNLRLMDNLAKTPNVYVLDAQRWLSAAGKNACSPKLWYLGKIPFSSEVFAEAARDIQAAVGALGGEARKLLVLDLDDTLWGGIVGDVGWENLRLGGHDGLGEAFADFQHAVKNLTRRGIVLAVVSKNEEATALEAIRSHPEMVLREDAFVAHRINWRDKAQNILEIAKELNLGLQSVVFIDDNPVERARVREALPEVLVPEWPEDKHLYRSALASLRCFDTPSISKEDQERTALYAAERQREKLQASVGSMEEWLKSLGIVVTGEPVGPSNLARTVQLLNKTNQLNLSTRRLTEAELLEWVGGPGRSLWTINVSDRFGDAGLTGIVSVEVEGAEAKIVDFVLSCRVMGRRVEDTMVHVAVERARAQGAQRVVAHFRPTAKNKPCLSFWQGSGFANDGGERFSWDSSKPYALPDVVRLELRT